MTVIHSAMMIMNRVNNAAKNGPNYLQMAYALTVNQKNNISMDKYDKLKQADDTICRLGHIVHRVEINKSIIYQCKSCYSEFTPKI
ncbi:hypothetical protein LCGC14_0195050 [marine sediment metagenome]|uniref:Uncharacterized protein n=1 Tax=marine sediment metagenome TaxID=412755 RepID=A0A0F9V1S4_9ZZZZ